LRPDAMLGNVRRSSQTETSRFYGWRFGVLGLFGSVLLDSHRLRAQGEWRPSKGSRIHQQRAPTATSRPITVIECLVGRFSLLWDKVLTDIHPEHDYQDLGRAKVSGLYEWTDHLEYPKPRWKDFKGLGINEYDQRYLLWDAHKSIKLPTVDEGGYHGSGPEYPGGSWHVEGMANERIVASGIYYYDCENITESQLAFRVAITCEAAQYEQNDSEGIRLTWGLESLIDPTKPGHRKIVALFLLDPENRISSTSDIPPQQSHWTREAIFGALVKDNQTMKAPLPVELVDMVADQVDNVMTLDEAKAYRLGLMDERTGFVDVVDQQRFCTDFSFCEH
ncbi:hypothetical protein FRC01_008817, partial [Tulasnella sp. 417]